MTFDPAKLGKRIRWHRIGAQMSQSELARATGVSESTIVKWESGRMSPRSDALFSIATVLRVSSDHLMCIGVRKCRTCTDQYLEEKYRHERLTRGEDW